MMKKITYLVFASWLLIACGGEKNPNKLEAFPPRFTKADTTKGAKKLAKQNNQFALNFYSKLKNGQAQQGKNLFFSPFSLHTALGMLSLGTSNACKAELAQVLGIQGTNEAGKDYYNLQGSVLKGLAGKAEIALSNAVWISDQAKVLPAYQNAVKENFETEIFKGKLDSPETIKQINDWVSKNTKGRIPNIIEKDNQPNEMTRLILLNALYFKSIWAEGYEFEKEGTKEEDFTLPTATKVKVQMMNQYGGSFLYLETPTMQMVAIPYKDYASYLYIILPRENMNLPALEATFTPENINLWLSQMKDTDSERVAIPKILMQTRFFANETLKNMGAKAVFDEDKPIHLNGIDNGVQYLFVKNVVHKTFLEINEKGSEAAAVTEVEVEEKKEEAPPPPPKKFTFVANRPYMFFIAEADLSTILFMGRVMNPLEK